MKFTDGKIFIEIHRYIEKKGCVEMNLSDVKLYSFRWGAGDWLVAYQLFYDSEIGWLRYTDFLKEFENAFSEKDEFEYSFEIAKVLVNEKYKLVALKGTRRNKSLISAKSLPYVGVSVMSNEWSCMGNLPKDFCNMKWPKYSSYFINEKNKLSSAQESVIYEFIDMLQRKCERTEPVKVKKEDYINGTKFTYQEKRDYEKYSCLMQDAFTEDVYEAYKEHRDNIPQNN